MSLLNAERVGSQLPTHRTGPRPAGGEGDEAIELAALAGLILDPWQEDVLRVGCSRRTAGKWAAFEVALVVPRQNGKGSGLEALELHRLFRDDDCRLILHSAHEMKTAKDAFRRVITLIDDTPLLKKQVKAVRYTNGDEGIELVNGNRLRFVARSTGSARGFSADLIVLDEAYNLPEDAMAAMLPTLSARPNPQIWYTSSAPLLIPQSGFLRKLIRRGRAGATRRLAYAEWCAGPDDRIDDPEVWAVANPGLGIRITEETVANELEILEAEKFARERLGVFPDEESVEQVIPADRWTACESPGSRTDGGEVLAVDVSPNRDSASIAVAAPSLRGGMHVEVVEKRPYTRWLIPRLVELQERWGGRLVVGVGSPAWSLEEDLKKARLQLDPISKAEYAQACGGLYDTVIAGGLAHLGQRELDVAVSNAVRQNYDDAWLWSRRRSEVDISPLVAVTLAHWVAQKRQRKPKIW